MTLSEAMDRTTAERNLRQTIQQVMHLIHKAAGISA